MLEAARKAGVRKLVFSSTGGGLYGDAELLPTPETYEIAPMAPYGQSKLSAEGYFGLYHRLHGLSSVSLRYGNVYGPRQDVHGEAGVVAIFCGHLIEGTTPTIFGDGHQTRDWVDVADVVRANLLAADSQLTGPINIGHGQETSVLDLVQALNDVSGRPPLVPEFAPARAGELAAQLSRRDPGQARAALGAAGADARRPASRARLALAAGAGQPMPGIVTVAIPTLNAGPGFARTLGAVSRQRLDDRTELELIVCDSGLVGSDGGPGRHPRCARI